MTSFSTPVDKTSLLQFSNQRSNLSWHFLVGFG